MMDETKHTTLEIYEDTTDICRDHLRNVCQRGERCKFKHVKLEDLDHLVDTNKDPTSHNCDYAFCHNFQNKGCEWTQCKFIHCSKAIEENYKNNGLLPLRLKYEFEFGVHELSIGDTPSGDIPICRSFLKGECHRGNNCRFLHTEKLADEDIRLRLTQKRSWVQMNAIEVHNTESIDNSASTSYYKCLQGENNFLRQQLNDLKKQVLNLTATNEFLLEQNAKFRFNKQVQNSDNYSTVPPHSQGNIQSINSMPVPTQTSRQAVPVAITFSMAGQNPQVCTNETTHILTADNQAVIPNELVTNPSQQQGNTHHQTLQPQNRLPITCSIAPTIVPNVSINSNVQIATNGITPSNANGNGARSIINNLGNVLRSTLTQHPVPMQPTSFPLTVPQNSMHQPQSIAYSMTRSINNPLSSIATINQHPQTILATAGNLPATNSVPLQQALNQSIAQSSQNIAVGSTLVPSITVQTDSDNIVHANQNITQVTHRQAIVANNQQNQSSAASLTGGTIPGSIAAVAVQVVAQGSSIAQTNGYHQASGMSMSSAIIPVSIATSHQMSALVNSSGNIVVQPQCPRSHSGVSMAQSVPNCNAMVSMSVTQHQQVLPSMSMSGHRIVANQMSSPITYTLNPSGTVQHA